MQRDERAYLRDVIDACAAIHSALSGVEFTWMTTPLAVQRYPAARNSSGIDTHL
jgi:hypothetical protein